MTAAGRFRTAPGSELQHEVADRPADAGTGASRAATVAAMRQINTGLREALSLRRRVPTVLQTEAAECGLACLAMVLGHHGVRTDLLALRNRHSVSLSGMTLTALIDVAARENLATRALRLELEELHELRLPCILHWDMGHFVVLKSVSRKGAVVLDPATGERRMRISEVSKHFTGVALELWPEPGFAPRKEGTRLSVGQLIGTVRGLGGVVTRLLAFSVALEVFSLLHPQVTQWLTDHVLVSRDADLLSVLVIGMVLIALLQQGIAVLRSWLLTTVSASLKLQWRSNILTHLLRLPVSYFQKRHLGDVMSRFGSIDSIQATLTSAAVEAVLDGVMALIALGLMLLYSPTLAAIGVAAVLSYALLRWAMDAPLMHAREEEIMRSALQSSHLLESIRGIRALKLFSRENARRADWQTLLAAELNAGLRVSALRMAYGTARTLIGTAAEISVMWLGARAVLDGQMTLGMLLAFIAYRGQFHQRCTDLIGKLADVRLLRLDAQRLADIVLTPPETQRSADLPGATQLSPRRMASMPIELRGVRFRYGDHEPWVIDGLDLQIPEGQCVAIVGPSGCGKSTLVNLLLGDLAPTEGTVLVGGTDLQRFGKTAWRRVVGAVLQEDTLFAGTLADNIAFFDPEMDMAKVEGCARFAAIWDDIEHMPMGLQTLVGDMGTSLSGGQKQRVLLARALYKAPRLLVLDEATSALDVMREQQVNHAIAQLGITRIVIAHRPETVAATQRVVALDGGRVVFDGPTEDYLRILFQHRGPPPGEPAPPPPPPAPPKPNFRSW